MLTCAGELPENAKINETDTYADDGNDAGFEFADDDDEEGESGSDKEVDVDDI